MYNSINFHIYNFLIGILYLRRLVVHVIKELDAELLSTDVWKKLRTVKIEKD